MTNNFIPAGFVPLRQAVEIVATIIYGDELERAFTQDEGKRLSEAAVSYQNAARDARRKGEVFQPQPDSKEIAELKRIGRLRFEQLDFARDRLRELLHARVVRGDAISDHGHKECVPDYRWASSDFDEIYNSGEVKFAAGATYSEYAFRGRVIIRRSDLTRDKFVSDGPEDKQEPDSGGLPLRKGGRPPAFAWDDIWVEVCRTVHDEGLPSTQAEMIRKIADWCMQRYGKSPDDSTLKPKIRRLFQVLRVDGN